MKGRRISEGLGLGEFGVLFVGMGFGDFAVGSGNGLGSSGLVLEVVWVRVAGG